MRYADFLKKLWGACWPDEWVEYGSVNEGATSYSLLAFYGPRLSIRKPDLIITAGFHGEEQAGPLTLLKRGEEIVEYAKSYGIAIALFPCINPSGFENKTRYNTSGERPNNAFMEYEVSPGNWRGELPDRATFRRTRSLWPDNMAKETKALFDKIKDETPTALLDLHQDNEVPGARTYAYVFGDKAPYTPLMDASKQFAEPLVSSVIDRGDKGDISVVTDASGLSEFYDGSITDYFWRHGTDYIATVETSCSTPLKAAMAVNVVWIKGFIDLIATRDHLPHQ